MSAKCANRDGPGIAPASMGRLLGRIVPLSLCALLTGLLAGCQQDDEIRRHQVPRIDKPSVRLLGAILPHDDRTWFFKLVGPVEVVDEHEKEFDRFLQSVRFTGKADKPVTWKVPEGWKEEAGSESRYATFRLGLEDSPLELSVTPLSGEAGSVLDNVNRWRGQIGARPILEGDLGQVTRKEKIEGVDATRVDMKGSRLGVTSSPPVAAGGKPAKGDVTGEGLSYRVPEGWKKQAKPVLMSVVTFQVGDGDRVAEITVSPLAGQAGGLVDNVNRWREQVGLGKVNEQQVRQDLRPMEVAGAAGQYVDLLGPEAAGPKRQRILGVVAVQGTKTWFFKMRGPAELVGKQKAAFEEFVKSVKFDEGRGAKQ